MSARGRLLVNHNGFFAERGGYPVRQGLYVQLFCPDDRFVLVLQTRGLSLGEVTHEADVIVG
jgi:hypothetical protein